MRLRSVGLDHPDARRLIAELQQEYVVRYGSEDVTPVEPAEFAPPRGTFVLGYLDGVPVACGGWRAQNASDPEFRDGDAEIKRMYVVASARGRGLSRLVLAELERRARLAGRLRLVLETGVRQPEAIGLYLASGYAETARFGVYRDTSSSRCFAKTLRPSGRPA